MRRLRRTRLGAAIVIAGACLSPSTHAIDEAEQRERIAHEAGMFETQLRNGAQLYGDAELDAYLNEITDRLFPDQKGRLRVRALKDPEFNAFALASGAIFFNTGALLRLQDEAQLASVLGHEGTHVTADHIYRSTRAAKDTSVVSLMGEVVAGAFGWPGGLASLAGFSSVAGFSRDHEREADLGGLERVVKGGYEPRAGAESFARLDRELTARRVNLGPYFFASHPRVKERVKTLGELVAPDAAPGERNVERYRAVTRRARMSALEQLQRAGDGAALVFLLGDEQLVDTLPPESRYYLAEGYRLRAQPRRNPPKDAPRGAEAAIARQRDLARAREEYLRTTREAPQFAPTWQALANQYLLAGDKAAALRNLERYVELEPDPARSGYARQSIESLRSQLGQEDP